MTASYCAGSSSNTGEAGDEVLEYITGVKAVPVPTYFIGATGLGADRAMEALKLAKSTASSDTPGLQYLGRSGLVNLKGLNIAFLDGTSQGQASGEEEQLDSGATCAAHSQVAVIAASPALLTIKQSAWCFFMNSLHKMITAACKRLCMITCRLFLNVLAVLPDHIVICDYSEHA